MAPNSSVLAAGEVATAVFWLHRGLNEENLNGVGDNHGDFAGKET